MKAWKTFTSTEKKHIHNNFKQTPEANTYHRQLPNKNGKSSYGTLRLHSQPSSPLSRRKWREVVVPRFTRMVDYDGDGNGSLR